METEKESKTSFLVSFYEYHDVTCIFVVGPNRLRTNYIM